MKSPGRKPAPGPSPLSRASRTSVSVEEIPALDDLGGFFDFKRYRKVFDLICEKYVASSSEFHPPIELVSFCDEADDLIRGAADELYEITDITSEITKPKLEFIFAHCFRKNLPAYSKLIFQNRAEKTPFADFLLKDLEVESREGDDLNKFLDLKIYSLVLDLEDSLNHPQDPKRKLKLTYSQLSLRSRAPSASSDG